MMRSRQLLAVSVLAAAISVSPVLGQDVIGARAGLINLAEGTVLVNDQEIHQNQHYEVLKDGDTLATEKGRAEILLAPGTFLRLGEDSSFRFDSTSLEDVRLTLLTGSAIIESAELEKDTGVEITVDGKPITLRKRGLYEFQAGDNARVRTYDGELALKKADGDTVKIGKDHEVNLNGTSLSAAKFDGDDTTALYRWGARRDRTLASATRSSASTYTSSGGIYNTSMLAGTRGGWIFNPLFGYYTYLPFSGYGYSPYNLIIVSPVTVNQPIARPSLGSSGLGMSAGPRSAVSGPAYLGGGGGGMIAAPAASAPAMASPNVGGGGGGGGAAAGGGGHRR